MTKEKRQEIGLFRYGIIVPLLNEDSKLSLNKRFLELSSKRYEKSNGESVSISPKTIQKWYYSYIKHGFEGILPRNRNDAGKIRKLDDEVLLVIEHYINEHPRMPATLIYTKLIETGYIAKKDVGLSTIQRYVKRLKKDKNVIITSEMKRYEAQHVNDIWCCDTTYSFKVNDNGIKKRMYIMAIIDDASRNIVGVDVFFNDNYVNFMSVLKEAVSKYGKPKVLNLDNGSTYKNKQIEILAARVGFTIHYCAPYSGWQKGKIERWFRTMKDHFMSEYNLTSQTTISEFKEDLLKYVAQYNQSAHKSLGNKSPLSRFFNSGDEIKRLSQDEIDKAFLLELDRKVSIDSVITIDNNLYEVPMKYAKQRITIRYSEDLKKVYVVNDDTLEEIKLLDKVANSKIKRKRAFYNIEETK